MSKTIGVILSLTDKCSPVLRGVAKMFGKTDKEATKFAQNVKRANHALFSTIGTVAGITAGAVATITVATKKVSEFGDRIDKNSKRVGMSAKEYQKWDFIMSQNGGNVDNLQGGIKSLTKQMGNFQAGQKGAVALFRQLGVQVKDSNGNLRNQEDVFNDCVKAIQSIDNPTKKAILGQKLFARGYQEMAPLLNQTADATDRLKKKYNDLGLGISDKDVESAVKMTDTMDQLGRSFEAVGLQLGIALLPAVQQLSSTIIESMPAIRSVAVPTLTAVGKVLGFVALNCNVLVPAIITLTGVIAGLRAGAALLNVTMWTFAVSNPFGWVLTAIGLITTLTAGVVLLVKHFKRLKDAKDDAKIGGDDKNNGGKSQKPAPKKHALGTASAEGGTALVGEYGPELVDLPRGSKVTPANDTKQALASSSNNVTINLNVQGNVLGNRDFMNEMLNIMGVELRKVMPA